MTHVEQTQREIQMKTRKQIQTFIYKQDHRHTHTNHACIHARMLYHCIAMHQIAFHCNTLHYTEYMHSYIQVHVPTRTYRHVWLCMQVHDICIYTSCTRLHMRIAHACINCWISSCTFACMDACVYTWACTCMSMHTHIFTYA